MSYISVADIRFLFFDKYKLINLNKRALINRKLINIFI